MTPTRIYYCFFLFSSFFLFVSSSSCACKWRRCSSALSPRLGGGVMFGYSALWWIDSFIYFCYFPLDLMDSLAVCSRYTDPLLRAVMDVKIKIQIKIIIPKGISEACRLQRKSCVGINRRRRRGDIKCCQTTTSCYTYRCLLDNVPVLVVLPFCLRSPFSRNSCSPIFAVSMAAWNQQCGLYSWKVYQLKKEKRSRAFYPISVGHERELEIPSETER